MEKSGAIGLREINSPKRLLVRKMWKGVHHGRFSIVSLNIKSDEADRLARELAERMGETLTQAVITALRERLERSRPTPDDDDLVDDVLKLADRFSRLRVLDARAPDEILGYDERGVPG